MLSMMAIDMRPQFESTVNSNCSSYLADITTYTETREPFNQGEETSITEAEVSVVDNTALLAFVEDLKKKLTEEKEKNLKLERDLKESFNSTLVEVDGDWKQKLANEKATELTELTEYEWAINESSSIVRDEKAGEKVEDEEVVEMETHLEDKDVEIIPQDSVISDLKFKFEENSGHLLSGSNQLGKKGENINGINEVTREMTNQDDILIKDLGSQLKDSLTLLKTEISHQLEEKEAKIEELERVIGENNDSIHLEKSLKEKDQIGKNSDQIFLKDILIEHLESQLQESLFLLQAETNNQLKQERTKIEELEKVIIEMNEKIFQHDIHIEDMVIQSKTSYKEEGKNARISEVIQEKDYQINLGDKSIQNLEQEGHILFQEVNYQLDEKVDKIRELRIYTKEKDIQIVQLSSLVQELKDELQKTFINLQERDNEVDEKAVIIEEMQEVIQHKNKQVTQQDILIQDLKSQLQETKRKVNDLEYKIGLVMEVGLIEEAPNTEEVGKLRECIEEERQKAIKAEEVLLEHTKRSFKHIQDLKNKNGEISSELVNEKIKVRNINGRLRDTIAELKEAEKNLECENKKVTLAAKMTEVALSLGHEANRSIAMRKSKELDMKRLRDHEKTTKTDIDEPFLEGQEQKCKIQNQKSKFSVERGILKENKLPDGQIFEADEKCKELKVDVENLSNNYEVNSILNSPKTSFNEDLKKNDDIKFIQRIKPLKKTRKWNPYCKEEDEKILNYMRANQISGPQRGTKMWKKMEMENVCTGRTWQSMKERWIKSIEPRLQNVSV